MIYEADGKSQFIKQLEKKIDIILLDFKLGSSNGIELLQHTKTLKNKAKVIALTGLEGTELILNLLRAGVNGIVYKLDGYSQIKQTIERVIEGESYFSQKVLYIIQKNAHTWEGASPVILSYQEKELLKAISAGLTTKEISVVLKMTEATIETYRVRLIKKVKAQNTASLIAYGFRNGLL